MEEICLGGFTIYMYVCVCACVYMNQTVLFSNSLEEPPYTKPVFVYGMFCT